MARLFAEAFAQDGFTVWWDAALRSGETFDEVIEQELRASKAVVVLWSPRSVASRWVRAEATLADRNHTLAPAIIEPCDRPIIFELTHTANLVHWTGDASDPAWQVFVKDVRRLVASGRAADANAESKAADLASAEARSAQPKPALAKAAAPAGNSLANGQVESLLSAVAALQDAIMKQNSPAPQAAVPAPAPQSHARPIIAPVPDDDDDDDDEVDATQFYTHGDEFAMMGSEELHCLEVSVGGEVDRRYIVNPLGLKIGRTAPADIILANSKVSRSHCTVELKENDLFVSDLNSTNGTFVDGQRVAGAAVLPVGSVLTVGHFTLVHEVRTRADV